MNPLLLLLITLFTRFIWKDKRIGYVIKTENKETPFTVVDIDGPSGNVKTLHEGVKKMCLVHTGKNLPAEKKAEFLATLIAMKLKGEI